LNQAFFLAVFGRSTLALGEKGLSGNWRLFPISADLSLKETHSFLNDLLVGA
jgi:hypothetical protein